MKAQLNRESKLWKIVGGEVLAEIVSAHERTGGDLDSIVAKIIATANE